MMNTLNFGIEEVNKLLTNIQEGMPVLDNEGQQVGTVKHVEFADDTDELGLTDDPLVLETPKPTRLRMKRAGFIRISTGLLRKDRYATSDLIDEVADTGVNLNVTAEELLTF